MCASSTTFQDSLRAHQLHGRGLVGFPLTVTLLSSDNDYLAYPAQGVIVIIEQGTDLSVISAVFHCLKDGGRLGPPVQIGKPVFTYRDARVNVRAPLPKMERRTLDALTAAEAFIAGFEDDESQDGIGLLLGKLRSLIQQHSVTTGATGG